MPFRTGLIVVAVTALAPDVLAQAGDAQEAERAIFVPACALDGTCGPGAMERDPAGALGQIAADELARASPVQVWGDRQADDPGARSVIDAAAIDETAADRPAEILNQAPGVNIQMNSGQEHLIAIRSPVLTGGAGQGSFLVLENGVPTRSPAFGNVNSLIEPHLEVADAIEVIRGPGSARYGSNTVHGLINVILPEAGSEQSLRASYGTLGRWRGDASVDLGESTRLNVSVMEDEGWRDATGGGQQKASLLTQAPLGGWDATAWISASNLNQETAGFIQGPRAYEDRDLAETNPNPEAFRDAWSARAAIRLERSLGPGDLILTPNLHSQAMVFSQHFLPFGGLEKNAHTGGGVMIRYDLDTDGRIEWRFGADVDLATGYLKEIQLRSNANPAFPRGIHYNYEVETQVFAAWSEADVALTESLDLKVGLRAETHDYSYDTRAPVGINGRFNVPADRSDSFNFVTPKLGLIWERDGYSLYANYARGARAPQTSDLYRLQNRQQVGEIEAETLESLEAGVRGEALYGHLEYDIAAYWMEKENFFFRDSDGLNVVDGSTRHQGVEAAARLKINSELSLVGNLAWSDQTYTFNRPVAATIERIVSGNRIDTAPEWMGDAAVSWRPSETLSLSLNAEYVGEYFTDPANTVIYPGHTVLGARAAWTFAGGMEAYLIVRNLTDEGYADRADVSFGNERYFPGEPLNATFGLTRRF